MVNAEAGRVNWKTRRKDRSIERAFPRGRECRCIVKSACSWRSQICLPHRIVNVRLGKEGQSISTPVSHGVVPVQQPERKSVASWRKVPKR